MSERQTSIKSDSAEEDSRYHIAIVGGGLVGLSMALALSRYSSMDYGRPLRVAVLEASPEKNREDIENIEESPRSIALSYGSRLIYESLMIWEKLSPYAQPIKNIQISERGGFGKAQLSDQDYMVPALGYVVGNEVLLSCLTEAAMSCPEIVFYRPARAKKMETHENKVSVFFREDEKEKMLSTELVILADGGRSPLMEQAGFTVRSSEYGHTAILAAVTHECPHNATAFEHFTDEGPMAMLPLPGHHQKKSAMIWTMPHDLAGERLQLTDDDFLAELKSRFGSRMDNFISLGQRLTFPLRLKTVPEPVGKGVVLMGNAAHSLHPVAGQGYNLSLRDTIILARLLAEAPENLSLGSMSLLRKYLGMQNRDQITTTLFSDHLVKLFTSSTPLVRHARNAGLVIMDKCKPLKRWFGYKAMGLGGHGQ